MKALAEQHVAEMQAKVAEMQAMIATLAHLAHSCHGDARPDCPIIEGLAAAGAEGGCDHGGCDH